jgi:hypothetical protein
MRFSKWLWLTLAALTGFGAAVGCLVYIANGVVVGDLWGLQGREHQIAVAQHQAKIGLLSCVLLQFGVAGALFSFMDREDYVVARIVWAVVLSIALTCACVMVILFGAKVFR